MNSEWKSFILSEICTKIGSGATPSGGKSSYNDKEEIALIRSQNVLDFVFSFDGLAYINPSQAQKLNNVEIEEEDVLINITGDSVARVCIVPTEVLPARVNQHVAILRANKSIFYPKLLKYLLLTYENKAQLLVLSSSGATRNALTKTMLENFEVFAPDDLEEQKKLADILQSFDDKIANNNRINQTLEAIAQALFKSWFVDFEPVKAKMQAAEEGSDPQLAAMCAISGKTEEELKQLSREKYKELSATADLFPDELLESELGMIPKGWKVSSLYDTAEYVNGAAFKATDFSAKQEGLPIVKIVELKAGITEQTKYTLNEMPVKYKIKDDDMLYSWSGSPETSLEVFKWFGGDGWLNQHIFKINTNSRQQKVFVYFLLKYLKPRLIEIAKNKQTTGLGHVTVADMQRMKVVVPSDKSMELIKEQMSNLFKMASNCLKQNAVLAVIRDRLLPELLIGKPSINQA